MNADEEYSPAEAASRRDEVIRRMANTPPQPKVKKKPTRRASAKSKASAKRARRKP